MNLRPITDVAADLGLTDEEIDSFGSYRAKIDLSALRDRVPDEDGQVVVVTAITPTTKGEGKTTTAISLTEGLAEIGTSVALTLREPSIGPVFGIKGGGTGGGRAQVVPMEAINLHLNGDIHAVTAAHNLIAAALDAAIYHGEPPGIDPSSVTWPRALDVNDRSLRNIVTGLGGRPHGTPREAHFVISAASEIMAILALAMDLADLRNRIGRIIVARNMQGGPVTAEDLGVAGSAAVLLKDALRPNLVQTLEGQPALVHAGPFGNIAHGNNSLLGLKMAQKFADLVVTEAGFGSDLGFEKFCHIACRYGSIRPSAAVLVATVRGVEAHGARDGMEPDLERGIDNVAAHLGIVRAFGLPCVLAVNRRPDDDSGKVAYLCELAEEAGADEIVVNDGFSGGGAGAVEMAESVIRACKSPEEFAPLYAPGTPVTAQLDILARRVYGASGIELAAPAERMAEWLVHQELDALPVCVAKTHLSLSHDPALLGRPTGFTLPVRDLQLAAGAGFVVAICGDIQLMPGLGRNPAYKRIDIDSSGRTVGLF